MSDDTMMWALLGFAVYGGAMTCACAFLIGEVTALKKKNIGTPFPAQPAGSPAFGFAPDQGGMFLGKPMSDYTVDELLIMAHSMQALEHEKWILSRPSYISAGEAGEYDDILRARAELEKRGVKS